MPIALVGSVGSVGSGTTTVTPSFAQATTAGNLLIAVTYTDNACSTSSSGWSSAIGVGTARIFYKPNCGAGETAPTFTGGTSQMFAALAEFSGVLTASPVDQTASNSATTSPQTLTLSGVDETTGELLVGCTAAFYSMSATKTTSHAYNNATVVNPAAWNNDATSTAHHRRWSYAITTANAVADTMTDTFTTTNITSHNSVAVSFKVAPTATSDIPPDPLSSYRRMPLLRR